VVLKLLRCGATVIVSTRFPHDAVARYAALPDYVRWRTRLHVYGLDLRDLPQLERFLAHLNQHYAHLDIIVNNACQYVVAYSRQGPSRG
jgi:NAD(P)-dependent dehydrogenase (short-subunit alcohol dehydrogenase family)